MGRWVGGEGGGRASRTALDRLMNAAVVWPSRVQGSGEVLQHRAPVVAPKDKGEVKGFQECWQLILQTASHV